MKNFTSDLKETIFHAFHDIYQFSLCFWTGNNVVIVSHDSQYLNW